MSNCNPCQPILPVCCPPEVETVNYNFANFNVTGVGVLDSVISTDVGFRGVVSDNAALAFSLDAGNHVIVLSLNNTTLFATIPDATQTVRGILEVATQPETNAGGADDKIITPLKLFTMASTETQRGVLEISTQAEVTTGTNDTTAVTPLKLATNLGTKALTRTFADAVARGTAVPAFEGQFGYQLDLNLAWVGYDTVAGAWLPLVGLGVSCGNTSANADTVVDISYGGSLLWGSIDSTGSMQFLDVAVVFQNNTWIWSNCTVDMSGVTMSIGAITVPANRVLITSGTPGDPSSKAIASFVSTSNVQTGYAAFANPATIRTCDTATVTLQQLAQLVGTLIGDLKVVLLPAT